MTTVLDYTKFQANTCMTYICVCLCLCTSCIHNDLYYFQDQISVISYCELQQEMTLVHLWATISSSCREMTAELGKNNLH